MQPSAQKHTSTPRDGRPDPTKLAQEFRSDARQRSRHSRQHRHARIHRAPPDAVTQRSHHDRAKHIDALYYRASMGHRKGCSGTSTRTISPQRIVWRPDVRSPFRYRRQRRQSSGIDGGLVFLNTKSGVRRISGRCRGCAQSDTIPSDRARIRLDSQHRSETDDEQDEVSEPEADRCFVSFKADISQFSVPCSCETPRCVAWISCLPFLSGLDYT